MEFSFETNVVLTIEIKEGKSVHKSTEFSLTVSDNLEEDHYLEDGYPTEPGVQAIANTLVQGLVGIIKLANHKGYSNKETTIQWITAELERSSSKEGDVEEGFYQ